MSTASSSDLETETLDAVADWVTYSITSDTGGFYEPYVTWRPFEMLEGLEVKSVKSLGFCVAQWLLSALLTPSPTPGLGKGWLEMKNPRASSFPISLISDSWRLRPHVGSVPHFCTLISTQCAQPVPACKRGAKTKNPTQRTWLPAPCSSSSQFITK